MATSLFLDTIPKEVRIAIFKCLFCNVVVVCGTSMPGQALADRQYDPAIFLTFRKIYEEALPALINTLQLQFVYGGCLDDLSSASKAKYLPPIQELLLDNENFEAFDLAIYPSLERLSFTTAQFTIPMDIDSAEEYEEFLTGGYDEDLASWAKDSRLEEEPNSPVSLAYNHPDRKFSIVRTFKTYPYGEDINDNDDEAPYFVSRRPRRNAISLTVKQSISYDMDTLAIVKKVEHTTPKRMFMEGREYVQGPDGVWQGLA